MKPIDPPEYFCPSETAPKPPRVSIVSGAVSRSLLEQLEALPLKGMARYEIRLGGLDFTLRRAYVKYEATGGLVLGCTYRKPFPLGFSRINKFTARIRKADPKQQEQRISRLVFRWIAEHNTERERVSYVQQLDKLCAPFIEDKKFLRWVDRKEKAWGVSDYATISISDCQRWIKAVQEWAERNGKDFVIQDEF